jgi:uncharacterized protein YqhQ
MPNSNTQNFNYGGQAVIEGVMMRGSKALAVAVRNPQGQIVVHTEPLDARIYGGRMARIPFVRGLTLLWDALGLGIKALMFSADIAIEEEEEAKSEEENPKSQIPNPNGEVNPKSQIPNPKSQIVSANGEGQKPKSEAFSGPAKVGTVAFSLTFAILLFFVLPAFLAGQAERLLGLADSQLASNAIEGVIRLLFLIGYIWAIGLLPDVKRLYGYHGAEHKTINAYEAGAELTPASVARFSLQHPRCGTAFLLTVVVISILFFSLFPPLPIGLRLVSRIVLLPVVAGIAYEFIRFTAKYQANPIIRLLIRPNLALQKLTTREPDMGMLEVAITAFERVLAYERGEVVEDKPVENFTELVGTHGN